MPDALRLAVRLKIGLLRVVLLWLAAAQASAFAAASSQHWVTDSQSRGAFELASADRMAEIRYSADDFPVVGIAARDLEKDLQTVLGAGRRRDSKHVVWIGTLGRNAELDALIGARRIDVSKLRGSWESYVITTLQAPQPGVDSALLIIGSDRRGTAYGAYELSQAIGVSPWYWWADVKPLRRSNLYVAAGTRRFGPPSVQYRGIFINDEDWGLHPWAARTFDPALGDIGPRTYAKVFELLLRLKANTLWPAMHEVTKAFNLYPENRVLADRYGIVMGSSHAEPMLRNNVTEWRHAPEAFNYATNRDGVLAYWRERVEESGGFENIYTLGMRGIHDSGIVGAETLEQRVQLMQRIFTDQRSLLAVRGKVPQVFVPYKEVLDIYRAGLVVPEDVTLLWPDDNFGYIRQLPSPAERRRSGGSGVYYHLSYLGAPLSYLWLSSTPPALIEEEMGRAYDAGARTLWIANVGDIKPAEIDTELFLRMAWDIEGFRRDGVRPFLTSLAARDLDDGCAAELASVLMETYRLNFERKPEHLQWWLPGQKPRFSELTIDQADARLAAFDALTVRVHELESRIPAERRDAFFELVTYPVSGSALANRRFFAAEAHDRLFNSDPGEAQRRGSEARVADLELAALTKRYNEEIAGGKWNGIMAVEPADGLWKSFRLSPPVLPAPVSQSSTSTGAGWSPSRAATQRLDANGKSDAVNIVVQAEDFLRPKRTNAMPVRLIEGVGRGRGSIVAPSVDYRVVLPEGRWTLSVEVVPTFATEPGRGLHLDIAIDGGAAAQVELRRETGDAVWASGVLDGRLAIATSFELAAGPHTIRVSMPDATVLLDALAFSPAVGRCSSSRDAARSCRPGH
jgi:hypothetical protein